MADSLANGNRKQRRQAAKDRSRSSGGDGSENDAPQIELRYPDKSGPKGKTLLDIAAERNLLREKPAEVDVVETDITAVNEVAAAGDADPIGPFGQAIFLAITLSMLHFTLDVLTYQQYSQAIEWNAIYKRTAMVVPQLIFVTYAFHSRSVSRYPLPKQLFLLAVSVASGCYLIFSANEHAYFAVMKRAPPVGTLLVWSFIEMNLWFSMSSLAAILGYLWWSGFTLL
ncbi:hypothetical protein EV356DRAFT_224647 [Viridothelium virens]|uniref:DUF7719 domain-containing protein n=1 Tax=Viridothelium virens TaxID=1048519 RepID=A0A6A6HLP2_VIRVR|nr:hypothetical protein EV356DRAFT_224647 [Viridothelium virens]